MKAVHNYGYERFTWEDRKLYHQKRYVGELVPHELYENHYHLKFSWRNTPTPEFFNVFNGQENLKRCALYRLNHDTWESHLGAPLVRLND